MEQLDLVSLISDGGVMVILSSLLMFFINAYRNEVNDHKETLKEIAMVREKQKEVQALVQANKTPTNIGI